MMRPHGRRSPEIVVKTEKSWVNCRAQPPAGRPVRKKGEMNEREREREREREEVEVREGGEALESKHAQRGRGTTKARARCLVPTASYQELHQCVSYYE
jgi:hypothetical protein